ncbi:hypothetical protein [Salinicoccus halitifaciens]|uniref:Uncharacterized protein n=1 Tax=Salinicoccus halitifaciens TaxID=1073415 RepID=A0ABV2E7V3_9STAP|nr:hypothetical protein [Salinicoccus halitifaciens]MCD2136449.1 hypothetical protein [Salinicoccus halitifaciens]
MHTSRVLKSDDFGFAVNNQKGDIEDIFPGFSPADRLGIVVNSDTGAIGASILLTATITKFYDFYRHLLGNEDDKLRIYPEFYIFHVGKQNMEHGALDVWPPSNEVVLQDEPEQILSAINERGITRLIVEDQELMPPILMRESFNSAKVRIKTALAFSPEGRVDDHDIEVTNNASIEEYVLMTIKEAKQYSGKEYEKVLSAWQALRDGSNFKQTFRSIDVMDAICMLTRNTALTITTSKNIDTVVGSGPEDFVFSPHIHVDKALERRKQPVTEG